MMTPPHVAIDICGLAPRLLNRVQRPGRIARHLA
jgi:hypothetical protein